MRRPFIALLVALGMLTAGCVGSPTGTTPSPTSEDRLSVSYEIQAGEVPDELRSVTVTYRVVFAETPDDLQRCWREALTGPYKPTLTPIGTPVGDCHRSATQQVDLATLDDGRQFGPISVPATFTGGHGLIVTNVTATFDNGTAARRIRGRGGYVANVVQGSPAGPYRVAFGLDAYRDRPYRYWLNATVSPASGSS